jgi:hypothetical protein
MGDLRSGEAERRTVDVGFARVPEKSQIEEGLSNEGRDPQGKR